MIFNIIAVHLRFVQFVIICSPDVNYGLFPRAGIPCGPDPGHRKGKSADYYQTP
jgi:hypothetical protein